MTGVNVDTTQTDKLLRLLDTVVIKLEGGTEEDLKVLDYKPIEAKPIEMNFAPSVTSIDKKTETSDGKSGDEDDDVIFTEPSEDKSESKTNDDAQSISETNTEDVKSTTETGTDVTASSEKSGKKRKRTTSGSSTSSHSSSSSSSGEDDDDDDKEKSKRQDNESEMTTTEAKTEISEIDEIIAEDSTMKSVDNESIKDDGLLSPHNGNQSGKEISEEPSEKIVDKEINENEQDENIADKKEIHITETIDLDKEGDSKSEADEKSGPRALHRTSSIFLRNLAPTITKGEVEAIFKRYNGFLRVAIADPLVERRWFRRGWVTFKRDINIKEICWNLNNIRLRDCELGAIVNRDLSRRVRPVNGVTAHKSIVRSDIKLCAKIAHNLDQKSNLWIEEKLVNNENGNQTFGLNSNNPVLQNITDYLIEEASAEEDELLGLSNNDNKDIEGEFIERDQQLINVLDKLILYLRIVHSVDFYNHCEYPYEDEMPNRCGIIHARGPPPQNKVNNNEIQEYIRNFENKMTSFLTKSEPLDNNELKKLGSKDTDAEVEKFVEANTQELAKDKWLCPLSGKKFKGPDFIRKHIFNKHGEKVDEVKKEVEYFNNYLKDPKRPQLPEHPGSSKKPPPEAPPAQGYAIAIPLLLLLTQPITLIVMKKKYTDSDPDILDQAICLLTIHMQDQ